jgi:hypothetical protein
MGTMISVILYGRNDSYGYNLHKRGVLSLNCIAEVLDDPDDEIIFVDYNTPDDLPTFVDAISDMLTPRARELLRTLRVRPSSHARFAQHTHLRCLESPARNAAVRRSNPRNRWILSTNTDMVFIPRSAPSLSTVAAKLPDGFYHTARFELPEILWETLDRSDPLLCIETIRDWGKRLQLNEVVYGYPDTIFDGPGDFQLFLRDDAFRIAGFDEQMLLGWHVDTNIAIRLAMLRGKQVDSVLDDIFAYHCDHTRETTPAHAHGAVQNSWERFITNVRTYELSEQRDSWGLVGEEIEEIRLTCEPPIVAALESLIPSMGDALYVTGIVNPRDIRYDPEHVVPYIANAIGAYPLNWSVGYDGCRRKTFDLFVSLWAALGFTGKILIPNGSPLMDNMVLTSSSVEVADDAEFRARANFFVFEMGRAQHDALPLPTGLRKTPDEGYEAVPLDDYTRILRVHRSFVRAVVDEQERGELQRRFVLINMLNNAMCRTATWRVGTAATPTGTHLTHGFALADPTRKRAADPIAWLQSRLSGIWPAGRDVLEPIVDAIKVGKELVVIDGLGTAAVDLARLLELSDAPSVFGVSADRLSGIARDILSRRFSTKARTRIQNEILEAVPASRSLSRIGLIEDFDDIEWGRWALRAWGVPPAQNRTVRQRRMWESTHILFALDKCKALAGRILLLTHPGDPVVTTQTLMSSVADWAGEYAIADITKSFPADAVYDGVVLSAAATEAAGIAGIPGVFAAVDKALKPGGVGVFICSTALDRSTQPAIDSRFLTSGRFDTLLEANTGWRLQGPLDLALTAATLDCANSDEGTQQLIRIDQRGRIRGSFVLVYRKENVTPSSGWDAFSAAFTAGAPTAVAVT